eukprot:3858240-Pyramimonas_sp.AAC.1
MFLAHPKIAAPFGPRAATRARSADNGDPGGVEATPPDAKRPRTAADKAPLEQLRDSIAAAG